MRRESSGIPAMVEVHAERDGRTLHSFAAHLLRLADGRIAEWWMVDAKPAESDAFWAVPSGGQSRVEEAFLRAAGASSV